MIPGSALRKLSAITGLEASRESPSCYRLKITEDVSFFSFLEDERAACDMLRKMNWARVERNVFETQGWKCKRCGQVKPLQGHHVLFKSRWRRSDGPLDIESNIEGLDQACHGQEHGIH